MKVKGRVQVASHVVCTNCKVWRMTHVQTEILSVQDERYYKMIDDHEV